ncbi:MAG TPA: LuxR C-terminal-related transcriptional regulator [Thermoanaerobaculia bacterium]|jgi:DNA-binding NarL/FixJ family response regulator|nr:LuxR C-terminal-related transcriptional regulator [Thermoanaerobaculia bacterium]
MTRELRGAIESLNCQQLDTQKRELLTLVDALLPFESEGNGNGNGHATHRRLSPRESEVLNMILAGRRLKEIAATLDISVKTVTTHRSRLLRKLGLEDNLGLYRYGVRNGLISV